MLEFLKTYASVFALVLTILGWIAIPTFNYFTNSFFGKKGRVQKISQKIVAIIKPLILDDGEINSQYIQSLINSICRQHNISENLLSVGTVLEDLLVDISEANYLGISQKTQVISIIQNLSSSLDKNLEEKRLEEYNAILDNDKNSSIKTFKFLLGSIISSIIIFIIIIFIFLNYLKTHYEEIYQLLNVKQSKIDPVFSFILIFNFLAFFTLFVLINILKRRNKKRRKDIETILNE